MRPGQIARRSSGVPVVSTIPPLTAVLETEASTMARAAVDRPMPCGALKRLTNESEMASTSVNPATRLEVTVPPPQY